jgi:hypothetical protein
LEVQTVTWPTSFADTKYTVVATWEDSCSTTMGCGVEGPIVVVSTGGKQSASVIVIVNNQSGNDLSGNVDIIAVHD